jgi:hypothetical protein
VEEIMPTKAFVEKYVVDYKKMNAVLRGKRTELKALQKKVTLAARVELELQIKAMDLLISRCKATMSKSYDAKAAKGIMSSKTCKGI